MYINRGMGKEDVVQILLLFSHPAITNSLQHHGLQHAFSLTISWRLAQVHVHCISDAIQLSHPLTPSSPSALNLSQHHFSFSHHMTKLLELQLHHQSFQWIFRVDFLQGWLVWSSCCPRDSQESSLAPQLAWLSFLKFGHLWDLKWNLIISFCTLFMITKAFAHLFLSSFLLQQITCLYLMEAPLLFFLWWLYRQHWSCRKAGP